MKRFYRFLLFLVSAAVLGAVIFCYPRGQVTILMYHHLVEDGEETNSMAVTATKFRRDMEYLRAHGYVTLLPEELDGILRSRQQCPERAVVISFDDGYESNYTIAYPILQELGCKAVVALITSNIHDEQDARKSAVHCGRERMQSTA